MPSPGFFVPGCLETAGDDARRHGGSDVTVESDLVVADKPELVDAVGPRDLEDERSRRSGGFAVIARAQPDDVRDQRIARALYGDLADTAVVEQAALAQRSGKMPGAGRERERARCHGSTSRNPANEKSHVEEHRLPVR